jgi:hypothetical protein
MIRKSSFAFWGSASKVWSLEWVSSARGLPAMCGSVSWSESRFWNEIGQSGNWKSISFNRRGIV